MAEQSALWVDPPTTPPFVAERTVVLDDPTTPPGALLIAALQVVGFYRGAGGDPHLMGHRGDSIGGELAAILAHHGWALTRRGHADDDDGDGGPCGDC